MAEADAGPPPTSAVLMSISKHIAVRCKKPNTAFIECKKADRNPEACLRQGNAVTSCTIDVYARPRRCTKLLPHRRPRRQASLVGKLSGRWVRAAQAERGQRQGARRAEDLH